jgi:predicted TIM-barrel fold metal-dependent hydrolase
LYQYIADLGMILSLHPTTHDDLDRLVLDFPRLNVIATHPGGKDNLDHHLDRLSRFDNAYLDLSGTGRRQNDGLS